MAQADSYLDVLVNAFVELAHSPKIAPGCDHIRDGYRRHSVDRHVIYFRVTDCDIAIIRVLHERMDVPRHL
jgi:toxin ParE1/3/4